MTRTVVPGPVRFSGQPNPRWWSFEDGRTDFGAVSPDSTDVVKALFLEFALVSGDDWFLLPCDLDEGVLARVDGVMVTDVFGRRSWVEPAGTGPDDDWQRWSMFNLDVAGTAPVAAQLGVFLPPTTPASEGPVVEDVLLVRDEAADMVWGIERTVWLATGSPMPGEEAARETLGYRQRLHPPPDPLDTRRGRRIRGDEHRAGELDPVHPRARPGRHPGDPAAAGRDAPGPRRPGPSGGQGPSPDDAAAAGPRRRPAVLRARGGGAARRHPAEPGVPPHPLVRRPARGLARPRRATGRGEARSGLDWDRIANTP